MASSQTWELWFPDAAATGLLFARARIPPTAVLWVHAAPPTLAVTVRGRTIGWWRAARLSRARARGYR